MIDDDEVFVADPDNPGFKYVKDGAEEYAEESDVICLLEPPPLPPPQGWQPEDFPQLTVDRVPYHCDAQVRADPYMTITSDGWLYIQAGNTRVAIPERAEWNKFVFMVECLWNAHRVAQGQPLEGENNDDSSQADERVDGGQTAPAGVDQPQSRSDVGAEGAPGPESG